MARGCMTRCEGSLQRSTGRILTAGASTIGAVFREQGQEGGRTRSKREWRDASQQLGMRSEVARAMRRNARKVVGRSRGALEAGSEPSGAPGKSTVVSVRPRAAVTAGGRARASRRPDWRRRRWRSRQTRPPTRTCRRRSATGARRRQIWASCAGKLCARGGRSVGRGSTVVGHGGGCAPGFLAGGRGGGAAGGS